jgi:hypothetical protein
MFGPTGHPDKEQAREEDRAAGHGHRPGPPRRNQHQGTLHHLQGEVWAGLSLPADWRQLEGQRSAGAALAGHDLQPTLLHERLIDRPDAATLHRALLQQNPQRLLHLGSLPQNMLILLPPQLPVRNGADELLRCDAGPEEVH